MTKEKLLQCDPGDIVSLESDHAARPQPWDGSTSALLRTTPRFEPSMPALVLATIDAPKDTFKKIKRFVLLQQHALIGWVSTGEGVMITDLLETQGRTTT